MKLPVRNIPYTGERNISSRDHSSTVPHSRAAGRRGRKRRILHQRAASDLFDALQKFLCNLSCFIRSRSETMDVVFGFRKPGTLSTVFDQITVSRQDKGRLFHNYRRFLYYGFSDDLSLLFYFFFFFPCGIQGSWATCA